MNNETRERYLKLARAAHRNALVIERERFPFSFALTFTRSDSNRRRPTWTTRHFSSSYFSLCLFLAAAGTVADAGSNIWSQSKILLR